MWTICGRLSIQVVRIAQNGNMPLLPLCKYNKGAKQGKTQRNGIKIDKISDVNLKSGLIYQKNKKQGRMIQFWAVKGWQCGRWLTLSYTSCSCISLISWLRPLEIYLHFVYSALSLQWPRPPRSFPSAVCRSEMGAGRREVLLESPSACRFAVCDVPAWS